MAVFVKRTGCAAFIAEDFSRVETTRISDVASLKARACTENRWDVPSRCRMYLIPEVGADGPSPDDITRSLEGIPLRIHFALGAAGITPGVWLVADFVPGIQQQAGARVKQSQALPIQQFHM